MQKHLIVLSLLLTGFLAHEASADAVDADDGSLRDEVPISEVVPGSYLYEDPASPFFKGPASVTRDAAGNPVLKTFRKFNNGASSPLQVVLKPAPGEKNLFRGYTKLPFPPVGPCGRAYANRTIELRVFEQGDSKAPLFYVREMGENGIRCRYFRKTSKPSCQCWWNEPNYDFAHPKPYVGDAP